MPGDLPLCGAERVSLHHDLCVERVGQFRLLFQESRCQMPRFLPRGGTERASRCTTISGKQGGVPSNGIYRSVPGHQAGSNCRCSSSPPAPGLQQGKAQF